MTTALLRALTPEAERAIGGATEITVDGYPFRVGRESRLDRKSAGARDERRGAALSPNNNLYLFDDGALKFVSREHFQIERPEDGRFVLRERGSVCGTQVGDAFLGGEREIGECVIEDGNTIAVGGPESPYVFQFVLAD